MNYNEFRNLFKRSKTVEFIARNLAWPLFEWQHLKSDYAAWRRKHGRIDKRYLWLKECRNKYKGERCFIVATGPSLLISDLDMLKNEYTFAMNSCILALDKTEWRPTFYGIEDEYVYEKLESAILNNTQLDIIVSDTIADLYKTPESFKVFPLHYLDHKMYHFKGCGKFKYSDDCYSIVGDGYSITLSLLQIACHMGFSEIYLLGCDCNYNQPKQHFIESGHFDPKAHLMGSKLIQAHREFKKFADSIGVKVFNSTRGGMLEEYPRINLDDVLQKNVKKGLDNE